MSKAFSFRYNYLLYRRAGGFKNAYKVLNERLKYKLRRQKAYKFNKYGSYATRTSYYGYGSDANPIAYRKKKRASYAKAFNIKGYRRA